MGFKGPLRPKAFYDSMAYLCFPSEMAYEK